MKLPARAVCAFLLVTCTCAAQAATVSLSPTLSGSLSYNSGLDLFGGGPYYYANDHLSYGWNRSYEMNAGEWVDSASTIYLVYDISGIQSDAIGVTLDTQFSSQGINSYQQLIINNLGLPFDITQAEHTLSLVDPAIVPALQGLPATYSEVDSSTLLALNGARQEVSTQLYDPDKSYEFALSQAGVDAVNSGEDYLVLAFVPGDAIDGGSDLQGFIDLANAPVLRVSTVPLPAAAWLFGSALVALVLRRRLPGRGRHALHRHPR